MIRAALKAGPALLSGKGRGVRSLAAIARGELIESAPTILLSAADCALQELTALGDYYFAHPENDDDGLVVLGLASLCNHDEAPNAEVRWRHAEGVGWIGDLTALRTIARGEEITRCYRCQPWFQVVA